MMPADFFKVNMNNNKKRKMVALKVLETSGVDHPAHLEEGWIVMKSANATEAPVSEEVEAMDRNTAVGIAAGYLNLSASMLGYSTGCCGCFQPQKMQEVLGLDNEPLLLMGVGFPDPDRNRRMHHKDENFKFPTITKSPIPTNIIR